MTSVWRLLWALPLVIAVGVTIMVALRRFVIPARPGSAQQRMRVQETLALSEHSRVHLLAVDEATYLVVESTQQITVHSSGAQPQGLSGSSTRLGPFWIRRPVERAR